jgi:hypothetical protein
MWFGVSERPFKGAKAKSLGGGPVSENGNFLGLLEPL